MDLRRTLLPRAVAAACAFALAACASDDAEPAAAAPAPVLSVALAHAEPAAVPARVPATGHVVAWQDAAIGADTDGLRLAEVLVDVGDRVQRHQVLARFDAALVDADVAEANAAVRLAEAEARQATLDAERARGLGGTGAIAAQEVERAAAAAQTAQARLDAAHAAAARQRVRRAQTEVRAPDDGIIAARTATVGNVVPAGEPLFRLIRGGRLEWRATVAGADVARLAPGQRAVLDVPGTPPVEGTLRIVAPTIDTQTLAGMAHVDLPADSGLRAGNFVRGHVDVGTQQRLVLPQSAVMLRDGFHVVMRVDADSAVALQKVTVERQVGDRVVIADGLAAGDAVIASGLAFLGEGDRVRIVEQGGADTDIAQAGSAP